MTNVIEIPGAARVGLTVTSVRAPLCPPVKHTTIAWGLALALVASACQVDGAGGDADGDADGDVDEGTHYMSPIFPVPGIDPRTDGVVIAHAESTTTSMSSKGELAGLTRDDTVGPGPSSPPRADLVTPSATYAFETGDTSDTNIDVGRTPADSNIAVSSTHVCLTARGAFACYTKGGQLVPLGAGTTARPYNAMELFNLSGISPPIANNGDPAKDGRVVFDPIRRRFFAVFQSRETTPRLLIAVSKSEDPRDGFWTYADLPDEHNADGTTATQDYDHVGVNQKYFLVTNHMTIGQVHYLYSAANLVNGTTYTRTRWTSSLAQHAGPAVHQTATDDAYYVNRDDATHVSVWVFHNGAVSRKTASYLLGSNIGVTPLGPIKAPQKDDGSKAPKPVPSVDFGNIGWDPQDVDYRGGKLTWVANESHVWSGQASANNVARIVRMDVSNLVASGTLSVDRDRAFGRASSDDPPDQIFDYGWPAVASNAAGDLVVGTLRTNASIFPQLRASLWPAGAADIESSVLTGASTGSNRDGGYHMAGASADPVTSAVYLSQMLTVPTLPSGTWWKVRVAKIQGVNRPDVVATSFTAPATVSLDVPFTVNVTVMNQGDASMPASVGKIYLTLFDTINPGTDTVIGTFNVPAIGVDGSAMMTVSCTIPSSLGGLNGQWTIGPALDRGLIATEHSEANNVNALLAGLHGNAHVVIQ